MKKLLSLCALLILGLSAIQASEPLDTMSYVYGHQSTLALMAGENDLMKSREDFEDYIRGIKDKHREMEQMNDSSYMMSYYLGAMEAVFITDGLSHTKKENLPPLHCIIAGLRKVGNGEISLPADTVAAMEVINRYGTKDAGAEKLDEDTECLFFTSYGIMKAYQPGLQQYLIDLKPGTECKENRRAFATAMADMLECYTQAPESPYALGRAAGTSLSLTIGEEHPFWPSFITGAEAALGLIEELIPRDTVEQLLNEAFVQESTAAEGGEFLEMLEEYLKKLNVEFNTPYLVNWKVTAGTVADVCAEVNQSFYGVMSQLNIEDAQLGGMLMATAYDDDSSIYEAALSAIKNTPLPDGYKWFCGRRDGSQTTVGIMQTVPLFTAEVHEAIVEFDSSTGMVTVPWKYDAADAIKWSEFTAANIGRHIAVEINGDYMFAPKVNQQITGGRCCITALSPEEINSLFKNAEEIVNQTPADIIEVIDAL